LLESSLQASAAEVQRQERSSTGIGVGLQRAA
jgi:hypothetical protein